MSATLIPIDAEGFQAFSDTFALDDTSVIFLSMAGHKDALKAIRAKLFTNRWLSTGAHDMSLLYRGSYRTIVRTLPSGIPHMAIYLKEDQNNPDTRYALTSNPQTLEPDLYFQTLLRHSKVPIHSVWKAWLYKRGAKQQEIESLTVYGIHGIKVHLNDNALAQDIADALKKGTLKKNIA